MFEVRNVVIGEGRPKVCVPLTGATAEEIFREAEEAYRCPAEIVEWRADFFENRNDDEAILEILKTVRDLIGNKVFFFAFRTKEEGGFVSVRDTEYVHIVKLAINSGLIDLVDIECCVSEYAALELIGYAKEHQVFSMGSNHSFMKTLTVSEMEYRIRYMQKLGVDMARIAVTVDRKKELFRLLSASYDLCEDLDFPLIIYAMGAQGAFSRVVCEFFGSCMTFGALDRQSSPGQIDVYPLSKMVALLHEI